MHHHKRRSRKHCSSKQPQWSLHATVAAATAVVAVADDAAWASLHGLGNDGTADVHRRKYDGDAATVPIDIASITTNGRRLPRKLASYG